MRKFRSLICFASICLALVLIVNILLTACSIPTQVFELRLSHHVPPTAPVAKALEEWTKKIEANTNGRVKFTIYPSESLAKGGDAYPSTVVGICDVAYVNLVYESSKWSLNNIVNLGTLPIPTDIRGTDIWDKLWAKYPEMLKEFEGVKVLSHVVSLPTSLHTKVAVRTVDDIKGMKIAAMGESLKISQNLGASPVNLSSGDWYASIEKGIIEGCMAPIGVVTDRGIQEFLTYHIDLGIGQGGNVVIINLARWNSFPPDIKAKFEELNSWLTDAIITANNQVIIEGWQKCAGQGIIKPTSEQLKLWMAAAEPASEEWIDANASKGPSREMYEYAQKLIEETK